MTAIPLILIVALFDRLISFMRGIGRFSPNAHYGALALEGVRAGRPFEGCGPFANLREPLTGARCGPANLPDYRILYLSPSPR